MILYFESTLVSSLHHLTLLLLISRFYTWKYKKAPLFCPLMSSENRLHIIGPICKLLANVVNGNIILRTLYASLTSSASVNMDLFHVIYFIYRSGYSSNPWERDEMKQLKWGSFLKKLFTSLYLFIHLASYTVEGYSDVYNMYICSYSYTDSMWKCLQHSPIFQEYWCEPACHCYFHLYLR